MEAIQRRKGEVSEMHEEKEMTTTKPQSTTEETPDACQWCVKGDKPHFLDADGTLVSITGNEGTLSHAYDVYWWPCLKFGVEIRCARACPASAAPVVEIRNTDDFPYANWITELPRWLDANREDDGSILLSKKVADQTLEILRAAVLPAAATAAPGEQQPLPPLPTLYAMFEEWRTSFPPDKQPEQDSPQTEQLIDAWIAGFAKHNKITCAATVERSDKTEALRNTNILCRSGEGRPKVEIWFKDLKAAQRIHKWLVSLANNTDEGAR